MTYLKNTIAKFKKWESARNLVFILYKLNLCMDMPEIVADKVLEGYEEENRAA